MGRTREWKKQSRTRYKAKMQATEVLQLILWTRQRTTRWLSTGVTMCCPNSTVEETRLVIWKTVTAKKKCECTLQEKSNKMIKWCLPNSQCYPCMRVLEDVVCHRKPTTLPALREETGNALAGISGTQSPKQQFALLIHGWKRKATTSSTSCHRRGRR